MYSIVVTNGLRMLCPPGRRPPSGRGRSARAAPSNTRTSCVTSLMEFLSSFAVRRGPGVLAAAGARPAPAAGGEAAGRARSPNPRKRANRRRRSRAYHCCRARSLVRRLLVASIGVISAVDAAPSAEGRARPASARLSAVNKVQEAVGAALPPRDPIAPVTASHPTLFLRGTGGQQIRSDGRSHLRSWGALAMHERLADLRPATSCEPTPPGGTPPL